MRRVLVCLAACLLVASGCDHSATSKPSPRTTQIEDLAKAPVDLTRGCPKPTKQPPYPPHGKLPVGAVVVRACRSPNDGPWVMPRMPSDALTSDPDRIVRLVDSLEPPPRHVMCADVGGTVMDLWFGYPGARASAVHIDTGGCGWTFTSPPGEWDQGAVDGPVNPLTEFQNALLDQRAQSDPPQRSWPQPRCNPSGQPLGLVKIRPRARFAAGTYCTMAADGLRWRSAPVPRRTLARIARMLKPDGHYGRCPRTFGVLKLVTVWGDRADLYWERCAITYVTPNGNRRWDPSPEIVRELNSLPLGPPHWQRRLDGSIAR